MLARLAQHRRELLVLGDGLGELALGLEETLLERANTLRSVLQSSAQDHDFFLQRLHLLLEVTHLAFVLSEASAASARPQWEEVTWRQSTSGASSSMNARWVTSSTR